MTITRIYIIRIENLKLRMTLIDEIRAKQAAVDFSGAISGIPEHKPEMLLIGCVDARKDPAKDLGIERGRALILRNIAALIRGTSVAPEQRETEAGALEFAVKVMKVKHIAVMGHTDCGGIRAAIMGIELPAIRKYLSPLNSIKAEVEKMDISLKEKTDLLEYEAVKMSVQNLRSYDYIKAAEDKGEISLHGWVIDIANGKLTEVA